MKLKPPKGYTSWAFLLTAEGLDNPMSAETLSLFIHNMPDDEFIETFDGATKEQAIQHLWLWELCFMPYWGVQELVNVICSSSYRDPELALRSIEFAQEVQELPNVFIPKTGVTWAMHRGYLITDSICDWVNVHKGWLGCPHDELKFKSQLEDNTTGLDKDKQLLWSDLFTRPPTNHSHLFEEIKENVTVYISEEGSLPNGVELWEHLKKKYEYNHKHKAIKLKEKSDPWNSESFKKRFSEWTKTGRKQDES